MTKILIAEDEGDIRELICLTLEISGFQVVEAANGAEAVNLARTEAPDLVLMDVRMPLMTGLDACVAIKADRKLKNIPVVFLSAKGQDSEVQMGLQAGAQEYLVKPFSPELLIKRIHVLLERTKSKKT